MWIALLLVVTRDEAEIEEPGAAVMLLSRA
jgi:hypothetical protein